MSEDTESREALHRFVERHRALTEPREGVVVVRLDRDLDFDTPPELVNVIRRLSEMDAVKALLLDFGAGKYVGEDGIQILHGCAYRARARGATFAVVAQHDAMRKIFDITGMILIIALYADLATALDAVAPYRE